MSFENPILREVLGIELMALEKDLMRAWHLPRLMQKLMDEQETRDPQERCVVLAIRAARHSMGGWDNAGLPDDLSGIGALLNLGPKPTLRLMHGRPRGRRPTGAGFADQLTGRRPSNQRPNLVRRTPHSKLSRLKPIVRASTSGSLMNQGCAQSSSASCRASSRGRCTRYTQ